MMKYTAIINNWHKRTGGVPSLRIFIQSWLEDKLNEYDVDLT